jgi:anti-sigma factor RsiW
LFNPLSEDAYINSQINLATDLADFSGRDDPGQLVLSDAMPLIEQAPWLRPGEPRVVPGVLDGEHAVLFRLGAIIGIATGILASVILAITAAKTLSDATDGKANYSEETGIVAGRAPAALEITNGKSNRR